MPTSTKKLYICVAGWPSSQTFVIPADHVDDIDAAAQAGGFSVLPNADAHRINWDLVTQYYFI